MLWRKSGLGEMKNEPQYLLLETECRARMYEWARGKGKQTDKRQEHRTSGQREQWGSVTWGSSQSHWMTNSTQRCVAEEQKAVIMEAKPPGLEGISGPPGLTCCSQKRKTNAHRCKANEFSTNQLGPRDKPPISKDLAHSPPNITVSFPVRIYLWISKAKKILFYHAGP